MRLCSLLSKGIRERKIPFLNAENATSQNDEKWVEHKDFGQEKYDSKRENLKNNLDRLEIQGP